MQAVDLYSRALDVPVFEADLLTEVGHQGYMITGSHRTANAQIQLATGPRASDCGRCAG